MNNDATFSDHLQSPTFQHCILLAKFFFFNVFLLTLDIGTDISTAVTFFTHGDIFWGLSTTLPILSPFLVKLTIAVAAILRCFFEKDKSGKRWINSAKLMVDLGSLPNLLWDFPLIHPIK